MKILALEFSSPQRSVAVFRPEIAGSPALEAEALETGGQTTKALGMLEDVLRQAGLEREEIECLAIGLGPGSYAGIRAAIALAQGWRLAREVRLLGISGAQVIAAQCHADALLGNAAVVIDAQRGEFYLANYEITAGGWREARPLRLANSAEVLACQAAGDVLVGPEATKWFPSARRVVPRAAMVAKLAAGRSDFVSAEKLEPIYLRETTFVKAPAPRRLPEFEAGRPGVG